MVIKMESDIPQFVDSSINKLLRLESNLRRLGYKFANPEGPIMLIPPGTSASLHKLCNEFEGIPALFFEWYDRLEYVDFRQCASQLLSPSQDATAGLGLNCSLVFEPLSQYSYRQKVLEANGCRCKNSKGQEFIPIGCNASNCMPKGVWLPDLSIDPDLYDAGVGPVSMATEILRAIQAGGFPFWQYQFSKRRFTSPISNTPRYLDILPELMEGVL